MIRLWTLVFMLLGAGLAWATSDTFPQSADRPEVGDFITTPSDTFYCSPTGDNGTGDGSFSNPWVDFIGASGNCGPGDLIYLRGGTYPTYDYVNFSRSQNRLTDDGTEANPIVITNYPGETVLYNDTDTIWCMTLGGDHQKLIGTMVGSDYGIQITGGISIHECDYSRVSNVEFISGTSNGGDLNPGMIADPLKYYDQQGMVISHNYFHDCAFALPEHRMTPVRFFAQTNTVVEYNLFENNQDMNTLQGSVYFKGLSTTNATVRHNTFINCRSGISYLMQGLIDGLQCYGNLFVNVGHSITFLCDLTNTGEINIYNNVSLDIPSDGAFFYYLNEHNDSGWAEHGDVYNNVIDGLALEMGWAAGSYDDQNLPDLFDYNLWYSSSDRNEPEAWTLRPGYYDHAVTSADAVTYNATTKTATVADDYAGRTAGRNGGCIGGFFWTSSSLAVTATRGTGTVTVTTTGRTGEVQYQVAESGETVHHIVADADSVTLPAGSGRLDTRVIDSTGSKRNHADAE